MPPAAIGNFNVVITQILNVSLTLIGSIFVVMLLYGGYQFLSAGSNKDLVQKAKNTLVFALIGIIISISAKIGLSMLGNFIGYNFGQFDICITPGCL
jgi:hypothetical protein